MPVFILDSYPAYICLRFHYYMSGEGIGELYMRTTGHFQYLVLNITGNQRNDWYEARFDIQQNNPYEQVRKISLIIF